MKLVIDASVSLKWILGAEDGEHDVAKAEAILAMISEGRDEAIQPPHWFAEVLAVIALKRRERIANALAMLQNVPHRLCSSMQVYSEAARLSSQLKHHLFDTLYHAVALEHGATLITADDKYFAKAFRLGNIKLLTNYSVL